MVSCFFSVPAGAWLTLSTVWKMRFRSSNRWVLPSTSAGAIVAAKWDVSNKMRGLECLVLAVHAAPPHSSRTTSAWGGRWKRSSERGKSWSGSSGEFWRTWTTPAGMRPTSEISSYLRVVDKTVSWPLGAKRPIKCCQATVDQMDHQQRLTVILWSQISW